MASVTQDRDFPGTSPSLPGDLVSSKRHFQDWSWYRRNRDNRRKYCGRGREMLPNLTHYAIIMGWMEVRMVGLFSVYHKKQQRLPAGLCIDQGWHRAPVPTGRAARAEASHAGRKEQWWAWPTWRLVQEARGWEGGRQTG